MAVSALAASHISDVETPYAVDCHGLLPEYACGVTYLTLEGYMHQLSYANAFWKCPCCNSNADFCGSIEDGPDDEE